MMALVLKFQHVGRIATMARKQQRVKVGPGKGRVRGRRRYLKFTVSFEETVGGSVLDFFRHWCDLIDVKSPGVDEALPKASEEQGYTIAGEEKPLCVIGDPINFRTKAHCHSQLIVPPLSISFEFNAYKE